MSASFASRAEIVRVPQVYRSVPEAIDTCIETLDPAERVIAGKLAAAFFSIFRVSAWLEAGCIWLDDFPRARPAHWAYGREPGASTSKGLVIAMRVFGAGPFQAGFGIVVQPDVQAAALCTVAVACGQSLPIRHSLASVAGQADTVSIEVRGSSIALFHRKWPRTHSPH